MTDDAAPNSMPEHARCTWCSAELTDPAAATCPSCGATLVGEGEPQLPGVTSLDPEAIRAARLPAPRQRSRLLAWISGDYENDTEKDEPAPPGSLAPPPPDVAAEMLRLEIAAEVADLEAEAGSIVAEAELEARASGRPPVTGQPTGNGIEPSGTDLAGTDVAATDAASESTGPSATA
ncbi:MAG TPA: hypothetical protein VH720_12190 [Candidatus Limnocylindrales bacterium]|jgi:hypothetical protein